MAEQSGPAFALDDVDFEAFYQGKAPIEGSDITFEVTPWDIGAPQPAVVELERAGGLRGEILDAGCGLGENALHLAAQGYRVTGIDGSATALEQARQRAAARGVEVEFVRADATSLAELDAERFDSVLDSALYHCLSEEQQRAYAAALHRVAKPGAALHLFCFADIDTRGFRLPTPISQENLRTNLGGHWDIVDIRPTRYVTSMTRDIVSRMDSDVFAALGITIDPDELELDEQGRVTGAVWHLHATRR